MLLLRTGSISFSPPRWLHLVPFLFLGLIPQLLGAQILTILSPNELYYTFSLKIQLLSYKQEGVSPLFLFCIERFILVNIYKLREKNAQFFFSGQKQYEQRSY